MNTNSPSSTHLSRVPRKCLAFRRVSGTNQSLARRQRRGNTILSFLGLLVAALVIGGVVWFTMFRGEKTKGPGPLVRQVSRGPYDSVVLEQGEVESSSNVEIRCEVKSRNGGGITILEVVPEGSLVKEGDLLVRLDSSALDQELVQQKIVVNTSQALLVQSQNTLEAAKIARKEYLEGTFKQEEKLYLGEVFLAEQNLRSAQLSFDSAQRLAAKGIISPLQLEGAKYGVDNARNQLDAAQTKVDVLRKYTKEKMLKQFDSDIATAEAKVRSDESSLQLELDKLKDIEDQIAKCTIRAPQNGQVVYANKYSSGRSGSSAEFVVEAGAMVREQQPIIRLPDSNNMQVKALINEARVTKVRPGLPVTIRVDALKDEIMQGVVIKVNQYAEPSSWSSGSVKKYAAFIRILNPPPALRTGMNAEVRIHVETRPDALQIPVQALVDHKGHYFVLVQNGDSYETREVTVGSTNDKVAVIDKGLTEGDFVVLNPRREATLQLPDLPDVAPAHVTAIAANVPSGPPGAVSSGGSPEDAPKRKGGGLTASSMLDRTLEQADTDKDGRLSMAELANVNERLRAQLEGADKNNDGFLDRSEMMPVMVAAVKRIQERNAGGGGGGPVGTGGGQ
jgi:HlyD family secretion protein